MKEVKNIIGAPQEAEEGGEQREVPVHRLKQEIEEQRQSDVERVRDEVDGVICKKMGLANEDLVGYCRQKVKQIDDTGKPSPGTRRRFRNALHHFAGPVLLLAAYWANTSKVKVLEITFGQG